MGTYESINRSLGEATAAGSGSFTQPEHCARLIADSVYDYVSETGGKTTVHWRNYLNGYRVHINPTASVVWGGSSVSWSSLDDDPFDGLTCPSQTFEVVDMVDICQDFKDEVDEYWGNGIGSGGDFRIEYVGSGAGPSARFNNIVIRNKADSDSGDRTFQDVYRPSGARHAHLWLVDSTPLSTSAGIDGTRPDEDLYLTQETRGARHGRTAADYGTDNWTPLMSVYMFESDGAAGCDAKMTFDLSATFTRIRDTDACTHTIEQSITCIWDADGDRQRAGTGIFDITTGSPHESNFIECNPS